jgi:zinc protease
MTRIIVRSLILFLFLLPVAAQAMKIDRVTSPGGIEAWLVQDRSIPVVALEFTFRGGAALEPAGQEGTASLLSAMLIEGAGEFDSQRFQASLEDRVVSLGFDAGLDTFGGSLKTLTENLGFSADMLRLALTAPRFDTVDLERVKARTVIGLRRAAEEPSTIAGRLWMSTAFPDHPYGRPTRGTPETVTGLNAEALRGFLRNNLTRDRLIIGAAGDITPEALGRVVDRVFGELPAKGGAVEVPEVTPKNLGRTLAARRAVPQSVVTLGHHGVKRDDPDYYAATIVNYILGGGGFNSRLTNEVREKRGLAYSVYSYIGSYDHAGLMMGGTATENARVAQSLEVIRQEWRKMHDEGPTESELANAKTFLTGSFPLRLDASNRIARLLVTIQYDDLGIDYIDRRTALIEGVTLADARRVARRLLQPDQLLTVVVGEPVGLTGAEEVPADAAPGGAPSRPARPTPPAGGGG